MNQDTRATDDRDAARKPYSPPTIKPLDVGNDTATGLKGYFCEDSCTYVAYFTTSGAG